MTKHKHKAGDAGGEGLTPGSEGCPGGGNSTPLQYSCLENPMDRGAWQAAVHGVLKSWTQISDTRMLIPNSQFHPFLSFHFGNHMFVFVVYIFKPPCSGVLYFHLDTDNISEPSSNHGLQSFSLFVSKIKDYPTVHKQSRLSL